MFLICASQLIHKVQLEDPLIKQFHAIKLNCAKQSDSEISKKKKTFIIKLISLAYQFLK